ncbi:MAG: hypothetical protein AAGA43_15790 [Bacteroidota bacterium]
MKSFIKKLNPRPDENQRIYSGDIIPNLMLTTFTFVLVLVAFSLLEEEFGEGTLSTYLRLLAAIVVILGGLFVFKVHSGIPPSKEIDDLYIDHAALTYTEFLKNEGKYDLESVANEIKEMQEMKEKVPIWKFKEWSFVNSTLPAFLQIKKGFRKKE